MYMQYSTYGSVGLMSVLELLGIIRLTFRQAEGRRVKNAVLCLKYIFLLLAS